tara:strand:- start:1010 stop:1939 length:930 start_codon:yes stop_codon:yes gene_type:complete
MNKFIALKYSSLKKVLIIGLIFFSCFADLHASQTVRIATYNLRNYLVSDRMVSGTWFKHYPKPEVEKAFIRKSILAVRPDVLVLQEMGVMPFLRELQEDLALDGIDYPYAILMEGADPIRHTAVLSKLEPKYIKKHQDLDFKYFDREESVSRGLLEVGFNQGFPWTLFSVHLKSRYTNEKADEQSKLRRTLEAKACRERILERMDKEGAFSDYLVVGDFNDGPSSAPMRRFYKKGGRLMAERLNATDSQGHYWTHFYKKEKSYTTVDGFVLSPNLMLKVVADSARIWDPKGAYVGSDHRMVYFDLALSK